MDPMRGILEAAADDRGVCFVSCGLNADWCVSAFCLSDAAPNITQGAYYIIDQEDDTWSLVRRFHDPDDEAEPNPHDDEAYDDSEDGNPDIRVLYSVDLAGFLDTSGAGNNHTQALEAAYQLVDAFLVATGEQA